MLEGVHRKRLEVSGEVASRHEGQYVRLHPNEVGIEASLIA